MKRILNKSRGAIIAFLLSVILFVLCLIIYVSEYDKAQKYVLQEVNKSFIHCAPYWGDSIFQIKGFYLYSSFDINRYKEKHDMTLMDEKGTFIISADLFHPEDHREYIRRSDETSLLNYDEYDLALVDSLWNNYLKRGGREVDVTVELHVKNLRDMFPEYNKYVADVPARCVPSTKKLPVRRVWATDTVGIGICNQGLLVGYVHIPVFTVLQHMEYWGWKRGSLLLLACIFFFYGCYKDKFLILMGEHVKIIGFSAVNITTGTITFRDGTIKILKENRLQLMQMLIDMPDYKLTKEEICAAFWPNRSLSACNPVYNTLISNFRVDIRPDATLKLEITSGEGVHLIEEKFTWKERFMRRKHFFFLFLCQTV